MSRPSGPNPVRGARASVSRGRRDFRPGAGQRLLQGGALEHLAGKGLADNPAGLEVAGIVDTREEFHAAGLEGARLEGGGVVGHQLGQQRGPERRLDAVAAGVGTAVGIFDAGLHAGVGVGRALARPDRLARAVDGNEILAHGGEQRDRLRQAFRLEPRADHVGREAEQGFAFDFLRALRQRGRAEVLELEHDVELGARDQRIGRRRRRDQRGEVEGVVGDEVTGDKRGAPSQHARQEQGAGYPAEDHFIRHPERSAQAPIWSRTVRSWMLSTRSSLTAMTSEMITSLSPTRMRSASRSMSRAWERVFSGSPKGPMKYGSTERTMRSWRRVCRSSVRARMGARPGRCAESAAALSPRWVKVTMREPGNSFAMTTAERMNLARSSRWMVGGVMSSESSSSTRREMESRTRMHSSGYLPTVVSPESMTQSACS